MSGKLGLLAELQRAADGTAPCMTTDAQLWVSEDWRERRIAARLCTDCPVLGQCRAAAEAEPVEVWGVWAGREYFEVTARGSRTEIVLPELDAARLGRLADAARESRPGSGQREELALELARLRRSGYQTGTLARAAGMSLPAVASASARGERLAQTRARLVEHEGDPDAVRLTMLRDRAATSGRGWRGAGSELVRERNRLLVRLRSREPGWWSWSRLGELAGLTAPGVGQILQRATAVTTPRPARGTVIAAEVEARAAVDPRVRRLAELRAVLADTSGRAHRAERAERTRLVVELWHDDPTAWSRRHLAVAAGTSRAWATNVVNAALKGTDTERAAG